MVGGETGLGENGVFGGGGGGGLQKLEQRARKCIELLGEYVE